MIQRVQTLFLLAIVATSAILIFKPFEVVKDGTTTYFVSLMPGALKAMIKPTIYAPMALNFLIMSFSLYTVFKFKKRKKQIKFSQIILVLSAILIGNLFMLTFLKTGNTGIVVDYTKYSFIPVINIVFAFLARWFIKKDEKLVRSADRIR